MRFGKAAWVEQGGYLFLVGFQAFRGKLGDNGDVTALFAQGFQPGFRPADEYKVGINARMVEHIFQRCGQSFIAAVGGEGMSNHHGFIAGNSPKTAD